MSKLKKYFAHETAIIDNGCKIGVDSKIWHFSHIMPGAMIGDNCNIGQNVFIANNVSLGSNVKVQNNVSLYTGVCCHDDVFLGPSVVFTNIKNPRSSVDRRGKFQDTLIRKGATIGANATIICGITIGRFAFIAAGAVITKDVADYALMKGVPAIQDGWISESGARLKFNNNTAICSITGQEYQLKDNICYRK
jgi:UDP-2-acetamido-3-amino-2,3-dideoxy-glucuronate N-acetyltransferase